MATPGAVAAPATVAATPTPTPDANIPPIDVPNPAILPTKTSISSPSPKPDVGVGSGDPGDSQSSNGLVLNGPDPKQPTAANSPSVNHPLDTNNVPGNNVPWNNKPSKTAPNNYHTPDVGIENHIPSINDFPNGSPVLDDSTTNNPAAGNDRPANTALDNAHDAPANSPSNHNLGLPQTDAQSQPSQQGQNQHPNPKPTPNHDSIEEPPINPSISNTLAAPSLNLAAHIASAFGYMPASTATPLSTANPDSNNVGSIKPHELAPLPDYLDDAMPEATPEITDTAETPGVAAVLAPQGTAVTALGDPSGTAIAIKGGDDDTGKVDSDSGVESNGHHLVSGSLSNVQSPEIVGLETTGRMTQAYHPSIPRRPGRILHMLAVW